MMKTHKQCQHMNRASDHIVLTTPQLRKLSKHSQELKFSHVPIARFWRNVDPSGKHLVSYWFGHQPVMEMWQGIDHGWNFAHNNGLNVRAILLCNDEGGDGTPAIAL